MLAEFESHLDRLEKQSELAGLVIRSGKPGSFIVGADLREFVAALDSPAEQIVAMCHRGRRLFQRLSTLPFVTVAAIDGLCLGGGAELAVWCDRRLMADVPKAQFGFPEIKLGLYPGWGGTARTSRIVGLASAVEMVTTGEPVDARTATLMGLATDRVPVERLQDAAIALVRAERQSRAYLEDRRRWSQPLAVNDTELTFLAATAGALIQQQTRGQYPAPPAALEMMLESASLDIETACVREAEGMAALFGSPVNRALINVFFLIDRNKKDTGIDRRDVQPAAVRSVGIVGAGIMGRGIAAANLKRNVSVSITDAAADALHAGVEKMLEEAAYNKQTKQPDPERAVHFASLLSATTNIDDLATADLVIEAVTENADVKRQIFARLEPRLRPEAVLASNTSTIPITRLAQGLSRPERFCGIHFFNPVRKMPLVEVIRGKATSDQTIATAVAYAKSIGKIPVVVNDGPGFLVNRLLSPFLTESVELLLDGAEPAAIERAARNFGMPMGPLHIYDMVGLDTAYYAGRVMYEAFPDRTVVSPVVECADQGGPIGAKERRRIFFVPPRSGTWRTRPEARRNHRALHARPTQFTSEQLTARLFLPMLLEATRELADGIARDPRDIDLALIHGLGFPPFKGGLLFWAKTLGIERILEMLEPLEPLGAAHAADADAVGNGQIRPAVLSTGTIELKGTKLEFTLQRVAEPGTLKRELQQDAMNRAVVIDCLRTPIGRAHSQRGVFRNVRSDDLAVAVVEALVKRTGIDPGQIEDVVLGNTQQQGEQGFNVARFAGLMAGLPMETGGTTVNRLCGSSLQALNQAAHAIMAGAEDVQIVGGLEHMQHIPMEAGLDLNPKLFRRTSRGALLMGVTAEFLAQTQGISREEQDAFALRSHQLAAAAQVGGHFRREIVPIWGHDEAGNRILVERDQCVRSDCSAEALAALKPAFMPGMGTVTAGNSSPLNDGAAALLVMSEEKAHALGLQAVGPRSWPRRWPASNRP